MAAEFLKILEQEFPLGAHINCQNQWIEDVRAFAEDSGISEEKDFETVLTIRKAIHTAAIQSAQCTDQKDCSWEWLLSARQVEQRTPEWYAETKNILTASEISAIFKAGRTRGSLVMSKASPPTAPITPRLVVEKRDTTSLDWGVRYEPVIKAHLEKTLGAKIYDLGRIRHRTYNKIAASPDGLFIESNIPALIGRLVEIKCPSTRIIKDDISFEYWCQMQLQMEVCDRSACEFVEAKIREGEPSSEAIDSGYITLQTDIQTNTSVYIYHETPSLEPIENKVNIETYGWELIQLRRVTVPRDVNWFEQSQVKISEFWTDVEAAKNGTWTMPLARSKKIVESKCEIID